MAKKLREIMSKEPVKVPGSTPIIEVARHMQRANIGSVIVEKGNKLCGLVTDRDITVRAVAEGRDPASTPVSEICSQALTTLSPDDDIERAVELMREKAIRRVLIVDSAQRAVGIVSLGDLAIERDSRSVLGRISAAPANS